MIQRCCEGLLPPHGWPSWTPVLPAGCRSACSGRSCLLPVLPSASWARRCRLPPTDASTARSQTCTEIHHRLFQRSYSSQLREWSCCRPAEGVKLLSSSWGSEAAVVQLSVMISWFFSWFKGFSLISYFTFVWLIILLYMLQTWGNKIELIKELLTWLWSRPEPAWRCRCSARRFLWRGWRPGSANTDDDDDDDDDDDVRGSNRDQIIMQTFKNDQIEIKDKMEIMFNLEKQKWKLILWKINIKHCMKKLII